jgi:hypothetical protein
MAPQLAGMKEVLMSLNKEIAKIEGRTLKGLIRSAIVIRRDMEKTSPVIPVDTGNLRASWFVVTSKGDKQNVDPSFKDDKGKMAAQHTRVINDVLSQLLGSKYPALSMGFTANYATEVHEDMTKKRKRPGSGPKFLESALIRNRNTILKLIREEAKISR